ncbi:hypothetical protein acdb102_31360 [Acidothermaceae bacterium B102]|nr:hypothetical protein acdb102_31360 [Acidothermaceae bacterium B102]
MDWQPLSRRERRQPLRGLEEGVPPHLVEPLTSWIRSEFQNNYGGIEHADWLRHIASMNRVVLSPGITDAGALGSVLKRCIEDADLCLDFIDTMLTYRQPGFESGVEQLRVRLLVGGSVYDVGPDGGSLVRRVDPTAALQAHESMQPRDVASAELAEAYRKAYGRQADPSDAWDHAIRAVESVLIPIVCPKKARPNLGGVAGDLKSAPQAWKLVLSNDESIGGVETLEAMLRLIWPNPDRHQDGSPKRVPSQAEAQAVVHLAITIVQWGRAGALLKR